LNLRDKQKPPDLLADSLTWGAALTERAGHGPCPVAGDMTARKTGAAFSYRLNAFEKLPLTYVSRYANLTVMSYSIVYFHSRVKAEIESWPDGILADYARIVELLMEFGPSLRMPQTPHTPEQELKIARKRMKEVQNG